MNFQETILFVFVAFMMLVDWPRVRKVLIVFVFRLLGQFIYSLHALGHARSEDQRVRTQSRRLNKSNL